MSRSYVEDIKLSLTVCELLHLWVTFVEGIDNNSLIKPARIDFAVCAVNDARSKSRKREFLPGISRSDEQRLSSLSGRNS